MKAITIHTAVADNAGQRYVAGATLHVGSGSNQVSLARAKLLVGRGLAADAGAGAARRPRAEESAATSAAD